MRQGGALHPAVALLAWESQETSLSPGHACLQTGTDTHLSHQPTPTPPPILGKQWVREEDWRNLKIVMGPSALCTAVLGELGGRRIV